MSKMLSGSPILMGDNTIPGVKVHPEVKELIPRIEEVCRNAGLEFYPIVVEFLTYDEFQKLLVTADFLCDTLTGSLAWNTRNLVVDMNMECIVSQRW